MTDPSLAVNLASTAGREAVLLQAGDVEQNPGPDQQSITLMDLVTDSDFIVSKRRDGTKVKEMLMGIYQKLAHSDIVPTSVITAGAKFFSTIVKRDKTKMSWNNFLSQNQISFEARVFLKVYITPSHSLYPAPCTIPGHRSSGHQQAPGGGAGGCQVRGWTYGLGHPCTLSMCRANGVEDNAADRSSL